MREPTIETTANTSQPFEESKEDSKIIINDSSATEDAKTEVSAAKPLSGQLTKGDED